MQAALAQIPGDGLAAYFAETASKFNARGSGLWSAFSAAARSDAAVAAVHRDLLARRLADHALVVDLFAARGLVASSAPRSELAAVLAHLSSPEGYQLLVEGYGWTVERYREWLASATLAALRAD